MKRPPETIPLPQPLRDVRLAAPGGAAARDDQAAYQRGRADAEAALRQQLLEQRAELVELQQHALAALRAAVPQALRQAEPALVTLALEAAQKLVSGLPVTADMVEAAIREALQQAEDTAELTVLLHPEDLQLLERNRQNDPAGQPGPAPLADLGGERLRFEASPAVTRGGCLVRTRFGVIDGRRETKAALLQAALATP
jgi:flagellar assembly protein FliH